VRAPFPIIIIITIIIIIITRRRRRRRRRKIIITLFKCQMYLALLNVLIGDTVNQ